MKDEDIRSDDRPLLMVREVEKVMVIFLILIYFMTEN